MTRAELIARMRQIDLIDFRDEDEDQHVAHLVDAIQSIVDGAVAAERRRHQADIERWKEAAVTAEKWRGLALSKDGDGRTVQRIQQEATDAERAACAKVCDDRAMRCESEAQRAIEDGEHDEVSAIRSTAWQISICAAEIRARSQA